MGTVHIVVISLCNFKQMLLDIKEDIDILKNLIRLWSQT